MQLDNCEVVLSPDFTTRALSFSLRPGQHAMVVGRNGAGKSVLLKVLSGQGDIVSGLRKIPKQVAVVSSFHQQQLIAAERKKDDADIVDVVPIPTKVKELLPAKKSDELVSLYSLLKLEPLLEKPFLALSTGETRKLLFAMAMATSPEVLILDEPWQGIDEVTRNSLMDYLQCIQQDIQIIIAVNRLQDMPDIPAVLTVMTNEAVAFQSEKAQSAAKNIADCETWFRLQHEKVKLPGTTKKCEEKNNVSGSPLVTLRNGSVSYDGNIVFSGVNWEINPGEHWQITGPNGAGKTCLLELLTGDNFQCYNNDLTLFGVKRGSGESIWDIKQHIGILSNAFHLSYRVDCSVSSVILSGFYDTIGLYERAGREQHSIAMAWLNMLGMSAKYDSPFQSLSFGDQRLVLIARAMIKYPRLLILDEPCNGLDALNRLTVLALIEQIAQQGRTTVLFVSNQKEDALPNIQRILNMRDYTPK